MEAIYDTEKCTKFEISKQKNRNYGNLLHQQQENREFQSWIHIL